MTDLSRTFDWEEYRNEDQTIDILKAYEQAYGIAGVNIGTMGTRYIQELQHMQQISSRQVASVIFVTASKLDGLPAKE